MATNQSIALEEDNEPDGTPEVTSIASGPRAMTLGRYRLVVELASGGMATVFLARAEGPAGFEKLVALKRIHPHLAKEKSFVDMFLDEARIASRIHHPSVCTVFDFGAADDTYYIAMEYLVGEPLSRVCKAIATNEDMAKSNRSPALAARIIADVCEGLHAAHELRGKDGKLLDVVHRDVSPQNLFISYDGHVKVVDFGIASATDRLHHTATGQIKGKFGYMAPEQAQAKNPDRRADVWSLGVVLWEFLTLKRLFRRPTTAQTLYAVLSDEVPPPSAVRAGIPPELDAIVLKAVCRDIDQRYATCRDFGRDLVRFIAKTGDAAGPADLADLMDKLFPEGKKRKQLLIDSASVEDGTVIDVAPVVPDETSNSSTSAFQPGDIVRRAVAQGRKAGAAVETLPVRERRVPKTALLIALVVVVGVSAGLGWKFGAPSAPAIATVTPPVNTPPDTVRTSPVGVPGNGTGIPATPEVGTPNGVATSGTGTPNVPAPGTGTGTPTVASNINGTAQAPAGTPSAGTTQIRRPHSGSSRPRNPTPPVGTGPTGTTVPTSNPNPPTNPPPGPGEGPQIRVTPIPNPPDNPPAPTSTLTGRVVVMTPGGWANVYDERGRFLGQSPVRATMSVGTHTLSIRPYGQPPARTVTVVVQAGQQSRLVEPVPPQ